MDAASAGLNPRPLEHLRAALVEQIARGRLAGAVLRVERHGVTGWFESLGWQDAVRGVAMRDDSIFRIYSMTKPVVSVALMMLVEQSRVLLRDPVAAYLPEFAAVRVGHERGGPLEAKAPARAITVHDLLRHTAGLSYAFFEPSAVRRRYIAANLFARTRTNAELSTALAGLPLVHEPGTIWEYSHATDVLGRLVEVLSGATLADHLQQAVFDPLGMVDTGFAVAETAHARIAEPLPDPPGGTAAQRLFDARTPAALQSGGGGLLSTAPDYARFVRMLCQGGTLDGHRLLGRKTVEFMTADHLGPLPRSGAVLPPGHGFGLGVAVKTALGEHTEPGSVGSYGWSGAAGTAFFVDPQESLFAILLTQAPSLFDEVRERFRQAVYAAIE